MANKPRSHNGGEPNLRNDDKVNIAIPRRLLNFAANAFTQVTVSMTVYSFSPYLPTAQPKQPPSLCPPAQSVTIPPKTFR